MNLADIIITQGDSITRIECGCAIWLLAVMMFFMVWSVGYRLSVRIQGGSQDDEDPVD